MNTLRNHSKSAAWILCIAIILASVMQTLFVVSAYNEPPSLVEIRETFFWGLALPVVFSILAALIISRQPGNRIGWLLFLPAITIVVPTGNYLSNPQSVLTPALWLLLWVDTWSWIPVIFPIFLIPLHFPTGRPPTKRWNWLNKLALVMWIIFMVLVALDETIGPINYDWRLANPIGSSSLELVWKYFDAFWGVGLAILAIGCFLSLVVRYRRAKTIERQQIKWLFFAAAIFTVVYVILIFVNNDEEPISEGAFSLLLPLSILTFPVAITIAILRYRLFDIDIIIRKTIVYGLVSALLALVYFGSVILLQNLFENVSGQQSPLSIVISTLLIAALFSPLRGRIQEVIDRRFYRRKYNAQQELAQFSRVAMDEVEISSLAGVLLETVEKTVQPARMSLWLKQPSQPSNSQGLSSPAGGGTTWLHWEELANE